MVKDFFGCSPPKERNEKVVGYNVYGDMWYNVYVQG
jgi:hypothetical protein